MAPEEQPSREASPFQGLPKKRTAEPDGPPPQGGPDMSWWEGPLDQVMGRKVDGRTSFIDSTSMTLEEANALTRLR